jgi:hypothetical protein
MSKKIQSFRIINLNWCSPEGLIRETWNNNRGKKRTLRLMQCAKLQSAHMGNMYNSLEETFLILLNMILVSLNLYLNAP